MSNRISIFFSVMEVPTDIAYLVIFGLLTYKMDYGQKSKPKDLTLLLVKAVLLPW
jgi:hypothetical protein